MSKRAVFTLAAAGAVIAPLLPARADAATVTVVDVRCLAVPAAPIVALKDPRVPKGDAKYKVRVVVSCTAPVDEVFVSGWLNLRAPNGRTAVGTVDAAHCTSEKLCKLDLAVDGPPKSIVTTVASASGRKKVVKPDPPKTKVIVVPPLLIH